MLFKNVVQTLKKKWLQLLAVGMIMFFSSLIYSAMYYTMSGLEQPTRDYLAEYIQEDFSIEMLSVLTSEEINLLQQELPAGVYLLSDLAAYNPDLLDQVLQKRIEEIRQRFPGLKLEIRQYKDFYFSHRDDEHRALMIKDGQEINLAYIEEGEYPAGERDIALTRIYAEKNELELGDTILLQGKPFQIKGFVLFPDYTYAVFDESIFVDNARVTLFLAQDTVFANMSGQAGFRIAGIFSDSEQREAYEQALLGLTSDIDAIRFVLSVTLTENQFRSGAIFDEFRTARIFGVGLGLIIAAIAVLIVALLLSRLIRSQRRQIGVLKALGYSRFKIAFPYLFMISLYAVPMLLAGYFAGIFSGAPLQKLMLDFYLIPSGSPRHSLPALAVAVLAPLGFFIVSGILVMYKLLAALPLDLLYMHRKDSINRLTRIASRLLVRKSGRAKFRYLYALQNTSKFLVFLIGIIFTTFLLLTGWMMNGMVDRMTLDFYHQLAYEYEAYLDPALDPPQIEAGQEKFLVYPHAFVSDLSVSIMGLEIDNQLYQLYDDQGEKITRMMADRAIISSSLSMKQRLHTGDTIQALIGGRPVELKVGGIANDYTSDRIYLSIETLSLIISDGATDQLYNGIYSLSEPDSDSYRVILTRQSVIEQIGLLQQFFQSVVYMLIGGSMIIAILILLALTSMTIEDNYYNISLLQVMGYSRREVNTMVLSSYLVYMLLSYLLSLPLALFSLGWVKDFFATGYNLVMPFRFHVSHAAISAGLLILVYLVGTWHGRRKIARIPLQEVLKAYSE